MNQEHREKILRLVVEEAIQRDKDKGMIIDNPTGYFNYKMARAEHQAKEDPSWLIRQKDRLMGSVQAPLGMRVCARCDAPLPPTVCFEYNGKDYCDLSCAEGTAMVVTLREWMENLYRKGEARGHRIVGDGKQGEEFIVTWEQAARFNPEIAEAIIREKKDESEF